MIDFTEQLRTKVERVESCLLWTGRKHERGYAVLTHGNPKVYGHRWVYEQVEGAIPPGYDIHHICHRPSCVNPIHLLAVPKDEHARYEPMALVCSRGHWLEPANVYRRLDRVGRLVRICRACCLEGHRRQRERAAAAEGRTLLPPNGEKTHCLKGHPYDEANTAFSRKGQRRCRECNKAYLRAYYVRRRTAIAVTPESVAA